MEYLDIIYPIDGWMQILLRCTKILSQHHLFCPFDLVLFYYVRTHLWMIMMESRIVLI